MDIKLKRYKLYSKKSKTTAVICIFVSALIASLSFISILSSRFNKDALNYDDYFSTNTFYNQYNQLIRDVVNINLAYVNEQNIRDGKTFKESQIVESFIQQYNIDPNLFETLLEEAENSEAIKGKNYSVSSNVHKLYSNPKSSFSITMEASSDEKMYSLTADSSYDSFEYGYKIFFESYPSFRQRAIQEQLNDYKSSISEVESYNNFLYSIETRNGVVVAGNSDKESIMNCDIYTVIDDIYTEGIGIVNSNYYYYYDSMSREMNSYYYNNYQNSIEKILQDNNCILYAAVRNTLLPGDKFYEQNESFNNIKTIIPIAFFLFTISVIIAIIAVIYLIVVAGKDSYDSEIKLTTADKLYNDVHTILILILLGVSSAISYALLATYFTMDSNGYSVYATLASIVALSMINIGAGLNYLLCISRQIKARRLFRNTLVSAVFRNISRAFTKRTFRGWIILCLMAYGAINVFLAIILLSSYYFGVYFITAAAFNIFAFILMVNSLKSLNQIMIAVKETYNGNLTYNIDIDTVAPSFIEFASDINGIQDGLKKAVDEAVKSERMKADLITNVSHDLKTPLTSIITYVDLLKKEEINNDRAKEFVNVLDEKSHRLKQLIEDLIEASKVSSGNISVNLERLDLNQLVMQATGEFEEKIANSALNFIINSDQNVFIKADGKHTWRIIENLVSNTIKYSLPNTRVYINIVKTSTLGILIIKNISSQPIAVSGEQLTERFVRGDESRTTEGNGLGLSIAKSLAQAQNGSMEIIVDGDLFKVIVQFPLCEDKPEITDNEGNN